MFQTLLLWWCASVCAVLSFVQFLPIAKRSLVALRTRRTEVRRLDELGIEIQDVIDSLQTGQVPTVEQWSRFQVSAPPWGELLLSIVRLLQSHGASLVPALKRFRDLIVWMRDASLEAQAKTASARMQCWMFVLGAPVLAAVLAFALPSVAQDLGTWTVLSVFGTALCLLGSAWVFRLSERAAWGGLVGEERFALLRLLGSGEKLVAFVRAGHPPDLAWTLSSMESFRTAFSSKRTFAVSAVEQCFARVMEAVDQGKPCSESLELCLGSLRSEFQNQIKRSVDSLATETLKPLFICVMPAILGLIGSAVWIEGSRFLGDDVLG